jgi:hypothetical protein
MEISSYLLASKSADKQKNVTLFSMYARKENHTWNEHINVSSTLIMAPALSNSPQ